MSRECRADDTEGAEGISEMTLAEDVDKGPGTATTGTWSIQTKLILVSLPNTKTCALQI